MPNLHPGIKKALPKASLLMVLLLAWPWTAHARMDSIFKPVRSYLLGCGFSAGRVDAVLSDPRLKFEGKVLAKMLSVRESKLNYKQFLRKSVVNKARKFLAKHESAFAGAQHETGVEPQVVVAILSVETRLGSYTGDYRVFNMLASQAVLNTREAKKRLSESWPAKRRKQVYSARNKARFAKRAKWAMGEVAALLRFSQGRGLDPLSIKGSPAGALGMAQFVPSSILAYGRDGNQDGMVELHHSEDAIYSVANYLRKHGWRPGLNHNRQMKVILTYNNSTPYASTVLELSRRLH